MEVKTAVSGQHFDMNIKVNIKSRDSNGKRNALFPARIGVFNAVVMQNTVVDTLTSGSCLHFRFPRVSSAWDFGEKAQIPVGFSINNSAVKRRGAIIASVAGFSFTANAGTAPLKAASVGAKTVIDHFVAARTNRCTVIINRKVFRIFEVAFIPVAKRYNGVDVPMVEQFISGIIVSGSIMNKSVEFQIRV